MEHSSEENIYQMQQQQQPRVNPKLGWDCGSFSGNGDQIPKKFLAKKKIKQDNLKSEHLSIKNNKFTVNPSMISESWLSKLPLSFISSNLVCK
jgi:hypothetical protein